MSRRALLVTGSLIAIAGIAMLVLVFQSGESVGAWVAKTYTPVEVTAAAAGEAAAPAAAGTKAYSAPGAPSEVASEIAEAHKPAERITTASGVFLRYQRDMVSVIPDGDGSRIEVDDIDTGYRRYHHYVGGYWGTYSGPAESFRGGGPGAGK